MHLMHENALNSQLIQTENASCRNNVHNLAFQCFHTMLSRVKGGPTGHRGSWFVRTSFLPECKTNRAQGSVRFLFLENCSWSERKSAVIPVITYKLRVQFVHTERGELQVRGWTQSGHLLFAILSLLHGLSLPTADGVPSKYGHFSLGHHRFRYRKQGTIWTSF